MKKNYQMIIFDVDGTLLDTTEGIVQAVQYAILQKKLPNINSNAIREFIGPPIQNSFHKFYGLEGKELQEISEIFRNYYKEHSLLLAKPYEKIFDLLDQLKRHGKMIAVATYKREDYARKLLKYFGFDSYSSLLYGADNENKLKKADIINKCIEKTNIHDRETVLMVGDSEHDASGAENAGIDFLGVAYGFGYKNKKEVLKNGYAIGACETVMELLDYIL